MKRFEIGKAYQHNSGMQLYICGMADTVMHGICFIAEEGWDRKFLKKRIAEMKKDAKRGGKTMLDMGEKITLAPISMKEEATVNWYEITKEKFLKNNTSK